MYQFDERHSVLHGFSDFYAKEIHPVLEEGEALRLISYRRGNLIHIFGFLACCICLGLYFFGKITGGELFVFIFFISLFTYTTRGVLLDKFIDKTKDVIIGGVCAYLELYYFLRPNDGVAKDKYQNFSAPNWGPFSVVPHIETMSSLGLVANYHHRSIEDIFFGKYRETQFFTHQLRLFKTSIEPGVGSKDVFVGQIWVINYDHKFTGETVVLRDRGLLNPRSKAKMKRVGLVDPIFEKIFEVYSTDQVEARYLLTPTFMQKLVDLEQSVDGKKIRFAFSGGKLLIAVETENRFEAGSMFDPLTSAERTQKILDEISAIYDVIDSVVTQKRPS